MIPCDNCFLLPICRNKGYEKLLEDCELITALLYRDYGERNMTRARTFEYIPYITEIRDKFKPPKWKIVDHKELGCLIEVVYNGGTFASTM